jgi:hypothetical protein
VKTKLTIVIAAITIVIAAALSYVIWQNSISNQGKPSGDIVSKDGIHWHPHLSIYIKGQKQEIPANIGISKQYSSSKWYDSMMDMTDFHTHDNSGTLHWEVMDGPVTKEHIQLKAFFDVWGKPFNSTQS